MLSSTEIRQKFLDFFQSKGHTIVPSASIVVKNDPTLLFTNAGMNQFKDYFLGNKKAPQPRVADTQKCLRVSGKHNDLEEVGVDTYHHTMFEMLGNWSFGDYFKKDAIAWSWELLTKEYGIPENRIYVTIFGGDDSEKLPRDEEALAEWTKWIAPDRILPFGKKDNFWEMGDTGPCGPCTEIHVDCRPDAERKSTDGKALVNNDHPQVIEIWNNVFMQFNRVWFDKAAFDTWEKESNGLENFKQERAKKIPQYTQLVNLPAKHVDTGMGFERLVRVLQNKQSNYDTDVFQPLISAISQISGKRYLDQPRSINETQQGIAMRVIADHIRAVSFCISDGQLPSNNGAGYVVRRILRRAVRYGYSSLELKEPFFYKLVPILADQFKNVFPELVNQIEFVSKVIKEEEASFYRTLASGIRRFYNYTMEASSPNSGGYVADKSDDDKTKDLYINTQTKYYQDRKNKNIAGEFAFELFDTYGFPIDLTSLMAKEQGWTVDMVGFEQSLKQQKDRSRAATTLDAENWQVLSDTQGSTFIGYDKLETETKVTRYRKVTAKGKESFQLVLHITPFYAESGGQVGDTGTLSFEGEVVEVTDTKKENDLIIHFVQKLPINITGVVTARVATDKRIKTAVHHSATHLLHAALRSVLGMHVAQKGSLVNQDNLRFDFSHFAKMTVDEIAAVETLVNEKIRENIPVVIKQMSKDEALQLGAMALFGEKYGDVVRVVIIDPKYSVELCGGTHIGATGQLGVFKIKHETAVAAGVRRIEAVSGIAAEMYINDQLKQLQEVKEQLKNPAEVTKAIRQITDDNAELKKRLENMENRILVGIRNELLHKDEIINGVTFVGDIIQVSSADALKKLCVDLKSHLNNCMVVLCANIDGKPSVAVAIADTVVAAKNLDAGKIIKEHVAPLIKGGGGGQKNLATAGGQDAANLQQVIDKVKTLLSV